MFKEISADTEHSKKMFEWLWNSRHITCNSQRNFHWNSDIFHPTWPRILSWSWEVRSRKVHSWKCEKSSFHDFSAFWRWAEKLHRIEVNLNYKKKTFCSWKNFHPKFRFGLMQTKVAIVKLITKYEVQPCEKSPIPMKFIPSNPFVSPVGGMWLNFKKIEWFFFILFFILHTYSLNKNFKVLFMFPLRIENKMFLSDSMHIYPKYSWYTCEDVWKLILCRNKVIACRLSINFIRIYVLVGRLGWLLTLPKRNSVAPWHSTWSGCCWFLYSLFSLFLSIG